MKAYMQKMGRSLMLPVATLPVAALFMGIGYWIDPSGWGGNNLLAAFLIKAGATILDNLGIIFAVGLSFGMAKDRDGSSALAGLIAFLVPMQLLAPETIAMFKGIELEEVNIAFQAINNKNVFIGILAGLIASAMYNRFNETTLPMALSFFSGKRSVPIVTSLVMLVVSAALIFVWPPVYGGLVTFGEGISSLGPVGAGLYGFFNRLLIPTGLHHALNNVFWFNIAGIDDIGKFWSSEGVKGVTGMYQAGFFPVMMFGLPAGAFAMYQCAREENKKTTASLMMAAAFASFFTGVTEPLEFSFMFVAWPLYVVHAILTGLSLFIAATFQWTAGFNFSAGFIDFILSLRVPIANKPYMLLVQGLVMALIYYFTFMFVIKKFNLMTPGREKVVIEDNRELTAAVGNDRFVVLASQIFDGLGGSNNIKSIDNCTTRLRLELEDTGRVNTEAIKATGVPGVKVIDAKNLQVIVGTEVQFVADALSRIHQAGGLGVVSKEDKTTNLYAVATGKLIALSDVTDDVFSTKMMGDGFAIKPTGKAIYTPVSGVITSVFPTKHAYGIKTNNGIEVLVHVGLDTVELKGEPFDVKVEEGQVVEKGTLLALVDIDKIQQAGKETDIIVVFTNKEDVDAVNMNSQDTVKENDLIGQVSVK